MSKSRLLIVVSAILLPVFVALSLWSSTATSDLYFRIDRFLSFGDGDGDTVFVLSNFLLLVDFVVLAAAAISSASNKK